MIPVGNVYSNIYAIRMTYIVFLVHPLVTHRQMKDQSKKVASLKHKEQVEKSKNARLMEEARKREDNLSENSQQVKVSRAFHVSTYFVLLIYAFTATSNLNWVLRLCRTIFARRWNASRNWRRP